MSTSIDGRLFVKISELDPGTYVAGADEFVFVQNGTTLKITGQTITDSIVELGNLASRAYVDAGIANLVNSAPETLDTLSELASALNNNENFAVTIAGLIEEKVSTSNFNTLFDSTLAARNTYHLAEGSNLYFTAERVLDVVGPLLADIVIPTDINQLSDVDGLLGSGGGSVGTDPSFNSVTVTDLNVQTVAFTGTGAVTITSGNDLNFVAAGAVTINGETFISLEDLKSVVALSTDFADFKSRVAGI